MHSTPEVLGGFDRNRFVTLQMMNGDALVLDRIQWPLGSQVAKIPGMCTAQCAPLQVWWRLRVPTYGPVMRVMSLVTTVSRTPRPTYTSLIRL